MSPRRAKAVGSGRVGDDPAAALRELLIDATEGLISRGPISAITTRDIARAAEVSDGVLYNYFDDKTALMLAALVRRYERLARRFYDSLPEAGTATVEDNIVAFGSGLLDLLVEAMPTIAGLLTEPILLHRLFAEIHSGELSPQYMQARLGDYLREEQRLGRLAAFDVAPAETLLMGSVIAMALSSQFGPMPDHAALAAELRPIVATILRGLA
jgi:AcrR family transcriptional regulator